MTGARRLAMIGLDAASLDFIQTRSSDLPHLRRVLADGTLHRIRSSADLLTGSVWPTFANAANPGEHGIYHHLQWDAGSMRMRRIDAAWLPYEPFWQGLARRGPRVLAIDVPLTFPPGPGDGVAVMNWGSHDSLTPFQCRPRSLEADIRRRFGMHPMGIEVPVGKSTAQIARIRDNLVRGARRKGEVIRWLLENVPWDFSIAVFGETHRGGHILWPEGPNSENVPADALLDVYRAVDEGLGTVLASPALENAGQIVFSLHGMGPNRSQEHFVPEIMDRINARFAGDAPGAPATPGPGGIVRRLRESVPPPIQNLIARMVPVSVRDEVVNRSVVGGHDWAKTPGFDLASDMHAYLRLNLKGRERHGSLDPEGPVLPRYLGWVRECFDSLRIVPCGEPLVSGFHFGTETFSGSRLDRLPDVIVTWRDHAPSERLESAVIGPVTAELATGRSGNHRRDGFCAFSIPGREVSPPRDGPGLAALVTSVLG